MVYDIAYGNTIILEQGNRQDVAQINMIEP